MADWNWDKFGDDDDDENEEGGAPRWQFGSRDGLIFLIDCSGAMFDKEDDAESAFDLCIKCTKSVIQNKIISSDRDLLGVVFFATKENKNASDFKHVYVMHDLAQPGAEQVLELEALLDEEDNNDFGKRYGHSDAFSLSDALWTCSNMFANCTQKLGFKRVMLFTNNDNPHENSPQLRKQAGAKMEDLHQNSIEVELMNINGPNGAFDTNVFYKDILYADEDETVATPDPAERFEELLQRVRVKDHKKRATSRIPLSIGSMKLQVGVYNLVRTCHKPYGVKLYKKTNEEVKTVSKTFLQETAEILMPQDMKKSQTYSGQQICFEQEEVKEMKQFGPSGLELMGFKPRSAWKKKHHVKPASFLYPDESSIEGSTTMFTAMLKKCLEKDVVAVCKYVRVRNSPPKFVVLVPQDEELDEHNVQTAPPGFHLVVLPFADDFRNVQFEKDLPRANPDQVEKAKEIIKKLNFTFTSESFENPVLQNHYCAVEAMALDRDQPEKVTDYTLPDNNRIAKRAGALIEEFKDLTFPEDYVPGQKKRKAPAAKKPKLEAGSVELDLEQEARAGKLGKLTVAVLNEAIRKANINPFGTRKAELIDSINAHFGL